MICDKCSNKNKRNICKICHDGDCYEEMEITNYERITKMTIEEVSRFIGAIKCNTLSAECGYPSCNGMEGKYCKGMDREVDLDILMWLKKVNTE